MATHDYIISNASGASVRADLNNALAAIVSNNSNATSPATTYAYQWWADTTTGQLKLRNSANSAWITIFELDGTMLMEDGSAASPGLSFASDTNTGFFSGGADKIGFATGGVERLEIGSSEVVFNDPSNDVDFRVESNGNTHMLFVDAGNDRVGINASSPAATLDVAGNQIFTAANPQIQFNAGGPIIKLPAANTLSFFTDSTTERARLDSSGRLLVGTSSNVPNSNNDTLQVAGTGGANLGLSRFVATFAGPEISFYKSRNATIGSHTVVQTDDVLANLYFYGSSGSNYQEGARITAAVEAGTKSASSMPSRLVFSTTADGASSPTERVRIDSKGRVLINDTSAATDDSFLTIKNGSGACEVNIMSSPSHASVLNLGDTGDYNIGRIKYEQSDNSLQFHTSNAEQARVDSVGRFMVGATSGDGKLVVRQAQNTTTAGTFANSHVKLTCLNTTDSNGFTGITYAGSTADNFGWTVGLRRVSASGTDTAFCFRHHNNSVSGNERMRLTGDANPALHIGKSDYNVNAAGVSIGAEGNLHGLIECTRDGNVSAQFARLTNDGVIVNFRQGASVEGTISVSGTTVSYNGGHLARWSQLAGGAERTEILRGTVLSNLDEMCEWAYEAQDAVLYTEEDELPEGVNVGDVKTPAVAAGTEDNEQLNRMKVSDVEGDVNVSGVFQTWDDDDDTYTNDFYCAMTGDFVIRIAQGTTVARGDLLMSAGDGTAKPQDDDIVRSKTIAKVTSTTVSTTYSDGSYCVPCVLMAC